MALFDFLTGSDEAEAAAAQNAALLNAYGNQAYNAYNTYQTGALNALGQGQQQALDTLNQGLQGQLGAYGGVTTAPLEAALATQQGVSTVPLQQAIGTLKGGAARSAAAGRAGVAAYTPLSQLGASYQPAVNSYYDALGLNGPEGVARAQQQFVSSPGVQQGIDLATQQAANQASALGITASGNTLNAIGDIARTQTLNDYYTNYLNQLAGFVPLQQQTVGQAASGTAGANQALAGILNQGATNVAGGQSNLFGGQQSVATNIAGAYGNLFGGQNTLAGNVAGAYGTWAPTAAGYQYGLGSDVSNVLGNVAAGQSQTAQNIAQGNIASNNAVAQAGAQNASNFWGALGAAGSAAAKAVGPGGAYGQPYPTYAPYGYKPA